VIATSKEAVELVTQVRLSRRWRNSYRALRTSLLLSNLGAPPKVIMITSALPGRKDDTSINCAVVLAQKGISSPADRCRPETAQHPQDLGDGTPKWAQQRPDRKRHPATDDHPFPRPANLFVLPRERPAESS